LLEERIFFILDSGELYEIDDIESNCSPLLEVTDGEVEPLGITSRIDVVLKDKII
jgi:hypothetical protein